jgi:hypothetical protein
MNGSSGSPNYIKFLHGCDFIFFLGWFHVPELSCVQRYYWVRFEVLVLWDLMVSSLVDRGACILEEHCVLMFRVNDLKCLA